MSHRIWDALLSAIEKRVNHHSFNTWFSPLVFRELKNNTITVEAPNEMFRDWITDNYMDVIEEALAELQLKNHTIKFLVRGEGEAPEWTSKDGVSDCLLYTSPSPRDS